MHRQTLGSCLKWGSDKTLLDSIFLLNIKKSKGHMQKINVFIIDDCLGKKFKAMNDTILKENFVVSMTFHWDHHAPKKIGILFDMRKCGNPS